MDDHDCRDVLRRVIAAVSDDLGALDLIISTEPPLVTGRFEPAGYKCPHGTTYWIEPTSEQILKWRQEERSGGEAALWDRLTRSSARSAPSSSSSPSSPSSATPRGASTTGGATGATGAATAP